VVPARGCVEEGEADDAWKKSGDGRLVDHVW